MIRRLSEPEAIADFDAKQKSVEESLDTLKSLVHDVVQGCTLRGRPFDTLKAYSCRTSQLLALTD